MDTIDSKHVGTIEGFDIDAHIVPDPDSDNIENDEGYDEATREAWLNDRWHFVGTIITASINGHELGSASLWGSAYGDMPGIEAWVSPLDGECDQFVNGYGPDLIAEAIAEARATLAAGSRATGRDLDALS